MGETRRRWIGEGERGNGGGDCVFPPSMERMVERVRQECHRLGLFIGRLGQFPVVRYFPTAALIHHVRSWLTSLGHFAIAGACPCAWRNALEATPVARHGGDHGVGVDELTVREEMGEEKKGERRGVLRSRRVAAEPRWHQGATGRALTCGCATYSCRLRGGRRS